jgi:hypothetical protein
MRRLARRQLHGDTLGPRNDEAAGRIDDDAAGRLAQARPHDLAVAIDPGDEPALAAAGLELDGAQAMTPQHRAGDDDGAVRCRDDVADGHAGRVRAEIDGPPRLAVRAEPRRPSMTAPVGER